MSIEIFGLGFDQGGNNNGITVIDISDLNDIRYCLDFKGIGKNREASLHTTLNGWGYVPAYYEESDMIMENNIPTLKALEKFRLIGLVSLADCWPYRAGRWRADGVAAVEQWKRDNEIVSSLGSLSLRDKTMNKIFEEAMKSDEADLSWVEEMEQLADFQRTLEARVLGDASRVEKAPYRTEIRCPQARATSTCPRFASSPLPRSAAFSRICPSDLWN